MDDDLMVAFSVTISTDLRVDNSSTWRRALCTAVSPLLCRMTIRVGLQCITRSFDFTSALLCIRRAISYSMATGLVESGHTPEVTPIPLPPPVSSPSHKLKGYDFYRTVLCSPKYVVAPMVDQSELPWRILARRYGAQLVYTPMINAKMFCLNKGKKGYRDKFFDLSHGEEGGPADRPLIIQFCANDPEQLLESARVLQDRCDAIDLNLGCPQEIARSGHYGAFLMEDWDLVYKLINTLHRELKVPVTAKFRVFPTIEKTVEYARMLERAGAQILTCHGRLREQRGQNAGLADWAKIRAIKQAVSVPVFANGNILYHSDIERCLAETGADAVMSAEGQLYNPALFTSATMGDGTDSVPHAFDTGLHLPHADLALEYLEIVQGLKTPTSMSAVKGHLFKLLRPALARETDLRDELSKVRGPRSVERYMDVVREMKQRMDRDAKDKEGTPAEELIRLEPTTGLKILPHWLAQPYFRAQLTASTKDATKTVPKRVHGSDGGQHSEGEDDEGCGEERWRLEGIKRAKLATGSAVPLTL
ncbi:Dus-domain-containing protein [Imleria badia]|nr:Dus-domain-containing protein [Imleria badia]